MVCHVFPNLENLHTFAISHPGRNDIDGKDTFNGSVLVDGFAKHL